jgi:hypothetical protein
MDPAAMQQPLNDKLNYREARCEEIITSGQRFAKVTFREDGFHQHIAHNDTAPHLAATMLAYSKILMAEAFTDIKRMGGELLYTDTDSVKWAGSPTMFEQFERKYAMKKKQFGFFELEGIYDRFMTIGPKKYGAIKGVEPMNCQPDERTIEWAGAGIQARQNAETAEGTILDTFEAVLDGAKPLLNFFRIGAGSDKQLFHTVGAKKMLRFLCLKGRCLDENGRGVFESEHPMGTRPHRLEWWKDEHEFRTYAQSIRVSGLHDA